MLDRLDIRPKPLCLKVCYVKFVPNGLACLFANTLKENFNKHHQRVPNSCKIKKKTKKKTRLTFVEVDVCLKFLVVIKHESDQTRCAPTIH